MDYIEVRSPVTGVVTVWLAEIGEVVNSNKQDVKYYPSLHQNLRRFYQSYG